MGTRAPNGESSQGAAKKIDEVTVSDARAFLCSLVGRRFPRLTQLKMSRIKELVATRNQYTSRVSDWPPQVSKTRTYPNTKTKQIVKLVYFGNDGRHDGVREGERLRKQFGLMNVVQSLDDLGLMQRENEAWIWSGQAYPGCKNWVPSGRFTARRDAERGGKDRYLVDSAHISEYSRNHDVYIALEQSSRRRWLSGDLKYANPHEAKSALKCKATLNSVDQLGMEKDMVENKQKSATALADYKAQAKASRGCMLHTRFPAITQGNTVYCMQLQYQENL